MSTTKKVRRTQRAELHPVPRERRTNAEDGGENQDSPLGAGEGIVLRQAVALAPAFAETAPRVHEALEALEEAVEAFEAEAEDRENAAGYSAPPRIVTKNLAKQKRKGYDGPPKIVTR